MMFPEAILCLFRADDESPPNQIWQRLQFAGELLVVLVRSIVLYWYCVYKTFFPQEPKDVKGEIVLVSINLQCIFQ